MQLQIQWHIVSSKDFMNIKMFKFDVYKNKFDRSIFCITIDAVNCLVSTFCFLNINFFIVLFHPSILASCYDISILFSYHVVPCYFKPESLILFFKKVQNFIDACSQGISIETWPGNLLQWQKGLYLSLLLLHDEENYFVNRFLLYFSGSFSSFTIVFTSHWKLQNIYIWQNVVTTHSVK
jgi:hypothetical protein